MRVPEKAGWAAGRGGLRKTAVLEVEVKLLVQDRAEALGRLRKLKAKGNARMYEMNTLYDAPDGSLFRAGKLVRIRTLRPAGAGAPAGGAAGRGGKQGAILTYKGPVWGAEASPGQGHRYKVRQEHELAVEDAAAMAGIFEGMGLRPWFRYEKYRTTYRIPRVAGLLVELDETPIGDFLELEGEAGAIDCAAAMLGYRPADYITESYGALFLRERAARGETGRSAEMLFPGVPGEAGRKGSASHLAGAVRSGVGRGEG